MASVACDLHGPQPFRPPLSLGDEPLSAVDADSVRSAEAKAAVVVKEWLAFSADSQITDAAFNKAFRAILRILMSYGDEASLSGRPIPPIVTMIQDSLNVVAPKEALCNSLILYISAHSLQKPFLHPYVEAEILSSLLAAYASPWTETTPLRMDLRDFFADYASHSPLHQLELAEAFEILIPSMAGITCPLMLKSCASLIIPLVVRCTHPRRHVMAWSDYRGREHNAHLSVAVQLASYTTLLLDRPEDTARIVSVAIEHLCVDPRDLDSREGQFLIEIQAISSQFEREPSMQSLGKALALQLDQYKGARTFM